MQRIVAKLAAGLAVVVSSVVLVALLATVLAVALPRPPEGHRLPDWAPLGEGPALLAVTGTSLTRRGDWPEPLAAALSDCTGHEVGLLREAKSGAASDWGRTRIAAVAAAEPDILLIEFSVNDADLTDGVWPWTARRLHREMIAMVRAENPDIRIALMTMSPAIGLRGWVRPWRWHHEDLYRRLAVAEDLGLIDLAPLWREALAAGRPRAMIPDGGHPTAEAVARVALPEMTAFLCRALAGDGPGRDGA